MADSNAQAKKARRTSTTYVVSVLIAVGVGVFLGMLATLCFGVFVTLR